MKSAGEIAAALGSARRDGRSWRCLCPAHNDQTPSLSITEKGGKTLFKCRAGCDQGAVLAALRQRGLWAPNPIEADRGSQIVATYNYCDAEGALRYQVVRLAPKSFFQRRPNGAPDSFINNMDGVEPLPYRLPELIENRDSTVFICEGEKDVDIVADLGLIATCNHGGAGVGKWRPEISHWFVGRDVVILPDNDEVGHKHALDVAQKLESVASRVRILELPGLRHKGDVSDWRAAGGTRAQLEALAEDAPVFRPEAKQAPAPEQRSIRVTAGLLHQVADEGLAAMATAGVGFYQRDKKLVRVCLIKAKNCDGEDIFVPGVVPVSSAIIRRSLGQSARWEKSNAKGEVIQIDPPRDVV